jgi:dinuclear metal center YbgI/SA1388 family protein
MKLHEIVEKICDTLPIDTVSEQDNVGLIVGNYDAECEKVTLAYELNRGTLDEAIGENSDLLITYHTPLFRATKNFTTSARDPNLIFEAACAGINVFAVHTALDVIRDGLNFDLAARLGLTNIEFLSPLKGRLVKIAVFVPASHSDRVREALCEAGAGRIGGYSDCSFAAPGSGTFKPGLSTSPYVGESGKFEKVDELRLETIIPKVFAGRAIAEMLKVHPYEEPAYDIYPLSNVSSNCGFGAVGELEEPATLEEFLIRVKSALDLETVRISHTLNGRIRKVALCAGSGVSFYGEAIRKDADIFITGDVKHHDFREAGTRRTVLVDVTHLASEKFVAEVMVRLLKKVFSEDVAVAASGLKPANAISV